MTMKMMDTKNGPNPIDTHVGTRLRLRRTMLKMSQETLASLVGVTFQQIQKYESGTNRISASRLYLISSVLEVPIGFFFEGLENLPLQTLQQKEGAPVAIHDKQVFDFDPMRSTESLRLVNAFWKINDKGTREHLFMMILGMAGDQSGNNFK